MIRDMAGKKVIPPKRQEIERISGKVTIPEKSDTLSVSFSKFKLTPICLRGKFNNHFKDNQQYVSIVTSFLEVVLPKITAHSYNEIAGTNEGRQLHFHIIDDKHRKIAREVLKEYNFSDITIEQMFEGNNMYEFAASLGNACAARIVCHKVGDVLYFLFFDTNHHIYIDEKYVRESLFYKDCPKYLEDSCSYMPVDCFAVGYLDEKKIVESFKYTIKP